MEFKGTKGKWSIREINKFSRWINIEGENGKKLCEATCYTPESSPSREEAEFNALLISKAPELLEMLNDIKGYLGSDQRIKVEKLIKEATEI